MRWTSADKTFPVHLGAYNHRAEAFYRLDLTHSDHENVRLAKSRGLKRVQTLKFNTPDTVFGKVVHVLNQFHGGAGSSFLDYLSEAHLLEASWRSDCFNSGLTTNNPKYPALYEKFVLSKAGSANFHGFFRNWESYKNALSGPQLFFYA